MDTDDAWTGWEPAEDLLEYAEAAGYDITRTQLVRWHKRDLIPRPRLQYRQGRKGGETLYPPGTSSILLEVCELQLRRQPLEITRWHLWWKGADQDITEVRAFLAEVCADLDLNIEKLRRAIRSNRRVPGTTWTVRGFLNDSGDLSAPLGTIRKRLNWGRRQEFAIFTDALLRSVLGDTSTPSTEETEVFERALRFDEARKTPLHGKTDWVPPPDGAGLAWMATFLSRPLADTLANASDEDLLAARDEARSLAAFSITFGETMSWIFPRWGLGWGFVGRAIERFIDDARRQAFFVVLLHALRHDPKLSGSFSEMRHTMVSWEHQGYPSWSRVRLLASEVPAVGELLTTARIRRAYKEPRGFESLVVELASCRKDHAAEIDAVAVAHPELFVRAKELESSVVSSEVGT